MKARPLRVVAWVHGLYPHLRAGSETMLADMLQTLVQHGHEVHAVADSTGPENGDTSWEYQGVHCWREHHTTAPEFVGLLEPDVIVSHHHIGVDAVPLAKKLGAASAVILHNDFKWSRAMLHARPDLVVYNTWWLRRKMGTLGATPLIVHPPLHADRYALDTEPPAGSAVTLVNMDRNKGPDVFYMLARHLPDTPFIAVKGGYGSQDLREDGYPNVEHMGTTEDMRADVYARTRVLVMPSRYESYGRAAVEACAAGIPVIATPTVGLRESLAHGGTFASRGNPAEWLKHVRRYTTDTEAWGRASRAALARAAELDAMRRIELEAWAGAIGSAGRAARRRRVLRLVPTETALGRWRERLRRSLRATTPGTWTPTGPGSARDHRCRSSDLRSDARSGLPVPRGVSGGPRPPVKCSNQTAARLRPSQRPLWLVVACGSPMTPVPAGRGRGGCSPTGAGGRGRSRAPNPRA